MATERQIAANRANAQKSTGPKTAAGRLKSSRNAYRHGLSSSLPFDPISAAKARVLAKVLAGGDGSEEQLTAAHAVAEAQFDLVRIRAIRATMAASIDLVSGNQMELRRLLALDRYERFAHTKRRRACNKL